MQKRNSKNTAPEEDMLLKHVGGGLVQSLITLFPASVEISFFFPFLSWTNSCNLLGVTFMFFDS